MVNSPNRYSIALLSFAAVLSLSACASHSSNERVQTRALLSAAQDVNPDLNGRPSPVVVRIYQLRGDAEFSKADFMGLFVREKEVLGGNLIDVEEFDLHPGESLETRLPMARDTRYIAAAAGFRDIGNAQWRTLQQRPSRSIFFSERIGVKVDRGALALSIKH
jgi:type VI secretion system protein VasD